MVTDRPLSRDRLREFLIARDWDALRVHLEGVNAADIAIHLSGLPLVEQRRVLEALDNDQTAAIFAINPAPK